MQKGFFSVQYLLMGAVPFRKDVLRLKQLGVGGVITLNEPFETLVPSSLYNVGSMSPILIVKSFIYLWSIWWCQIVLGLWHGASSDTNTGLPVCSFDCRHNTSRQLHSQWVWCRALFYPCLHLVWLLTMHSLYVTENALLGKTTYVHCKAGRGRSTTVVLCYLASP